MLEDNVEAAVGCESFDGEDDISVSSSEPPIL
jgi:hypothetical protein